MLDFTQSAKRFLAVNLINNQQVRVRMPTKRVFDALLGLRDRLSGRITDDAGQLDEIFGLITRVWRWNMSGLSYSATGYDGPYTTAITMDGQIVANIITTGTLSADRIAAHTLTADKLAVGTITAESRKTNLSLVGHAIARLGTGYVYGTYGTVLTEALLAAKLKQYPLNITKYLSFIRANWLGKPVQDCVGLIKGHYWTDDDGKIVYKLDGLPDVSANGLYNSASEKGLIATMPEIKGLIVWKNVHVGIYIGNGEVIEAHGTKSGVIKTRLTKTVNETGWTRWFKCPFIDYVTGAETKTIDTYVVQRGDSLWSIAEKLLGDGNRYLELAKLNNIAAPFTIHVGQVLSINGERLYTVKTGDSPWQIAQELLGDGRRYAEIVQLNNLKEPYTIYTGQILKIPRK